MRIEITYDQAVELLQRAVIEKGAGYVYKGHHNGNFKTCSYFNDGKPDCIIGHLFHYLGVTEHDLGECNENYNIGSMLTSRKVACDERTDRLLSTAQRLQDQRVPWGQAVEEAIKQSSRVLA